MRPEEVKVPKEKFVLVNENKKLKDKELVTKPVGFFMDAMHRFAKNKGSIVGAIVIGILVLFAIVVPIISPYTVSYRDTYYRYTLPKLFDSDNIDFLDGCTTKTVNETTFLYYYSMGQETGHNAIKRQEYSVKQVYNDAYAKEVPMYSYRLDSYQNAGTVFLTGVTSERYEAIQEYQDRTGKQVIYPITELSKRPEAAQDTHDANYWYETEMSGSITVPKNYKIDEENHTVSFTNIYAPYVVGTMKSSSFSEAHKIKLVEKDGGYAICFIEKVMEKINKTDEEGNPIENEYVNKKDSNGSDIKDEYEEQEVTYYDYLNCYYFNGDNVTVISNEIDDASVFIYDSTYKTFKTNITGHDDPSEDGYYFFAVPSTTGASVRLVKESLISSPDYCPFTIYTNENTQAGSFSEDNDYYFGTDRKTDQSKIFYFGGFNADKGNFSLGESSQKAKQIIVEEAGSGQYYLNVGEKKLTSYLHVVADGNNNVITETGDKTASSLWSFDATNKGLYVNVTGHTDASLDGDYYFAFNYVAGEVSEIVLAHKSALGEANHLYPLALYSNSTTQATAVEPGKSVFFGSKQIAIVSDKLFVNGQFDGDNYTSKMRIEGENKYQYSYARQTNGTYELRVNYYEYFIYYHKSVLKDRISQPYFLFGTTANGQDIITCLASGARFSFLLAIIVASVNLVVGAIFGAIEGYYGAKVDLIMERIVEILSAVPFMIVITLLKYHMGGTSDAIILFISFFLTGWIGMSGLVRMQFYRFKNQEYVLASRTLGAKDFRIMFKHIFPNALGTIITSCVLVIPGMIFSETSLSYLGIINLNSGSMTSVGTLLANAQPYLVSYPHMILFPAIFISLLMLCFNLFGNGLRDAFNPSLRGTED